MARKHEAENLLRNGLDASAIAAQMGISFASVVQYLCTRVGERALRHSDIYFAIPKDKRESLQRVLEAMERESHVSLQAFADDLTWEDVELFRSLRDRRIFAGDMYEYISETEIALHDLVRRTLVASFGDQEAGWWRQGISAVVRKKCAVRR
jgi:predicted transcriptional regulator